MISAEFHIVLHPQAVELEQIRRKLGIYFEMYLVFSQILPDWLMHEFDNPHATNDQEETYAKFIPFALGLPAYVVLSLAVESEAELPRITQRIIQELDNTFLPFETPYLMNVLTAEVLYTFAT